MNLPTGICRHCGEPIVGRRCNAIYCSVRCRLDAQSERLKQRRLAVEFRGLAVERQGYAHYGAPQVCEPGQRPFRPKRLDQV